PAGRPVVGYRLYAALGRQITWSSALGLFGSYALRNASGETTLQDYDLWTTSAFGSYNPRARGLSGLELYASLGYTQITARSGPQSGETESGLASDAAIT